MSVSNLFVSGDFWTEKKNSYLFLKKSHMRFKKSHMPPQSLQEYLNKLLPSCPCNPLFQNEAKCKAFDMKITGMSIFS